MIKQLQAEKDALASKFASLNEEHARMTQLYQQQQQQQQRETVIQSPEEENQDEMTEEKHLVTAAESHEPEQINLHNFTQFQTNFAALQVRKCLENIHFSFRSIDLGPVYSIDDRES